MHKVSPNLKQAFDFSKLVNSKDLTDNLPSIESLKKLVEAKDLPKFFQKYYPGESHGDIGINALKGGGIGALGGGALEALLGKGVPNESAWGKTKRIAGGGIRGGALGGLLGGGYGASKHLFDTAGNNTPSSGAPDKAPDKAPSGASEDSSSKGPSSEALQSKVDKLRELLKDKVTTQEKYNIGHDYSEDHFGNYAGQEIEKWNPATVAGAAGGGMIGYKMKADDLKTRAAELSDLVKDKGRGGAAANFGTSEISEWLKKNVDSKDWNTNWRKDYAASYDRNRPMTGVFGHSAARDYATNEVFGPFRDKLNDTLKASGLAVGDAADSAKIVDRTLQDFKRPAGIMSALKGFFNTENNPRGFQEAGAMAGLPRNVIQPLRRIGEVGGRTAAGAGIGGAVGFGVDSTIKHLLNKNWENISPAARDMYNLRGDSGSLEKMMESPKVESILKR